MLAWLSNMNDLADWGLNLDAWRLPCYRLPTELEGGDSGHNLYTMAYCAYHRPGLPMPISMLRAKQLLFSPDGWPRRHPDSTKWYGEPRRCSRDLLTPVLCFYSLPKAHTGFWPLIRTMAKHAFLFANNPVPNYAFNSHKRKVPDFLGPDIWSIALRGMMLRKLWLRALYPVLLLLDLHTLFSACYTLWGKPKSDQRNQALKTHFAAYYLATPISRLAFYVYNKSQPTAAFKAWWGSGGEPRIDRYMCSLYGE